MATATLISSNQQNNSNNFNSINFNDIKQVSHNFYFIYMNLSRKNLTFQKFYIILIKPH
jgi:hypothetical protein